MALILRYFTKFSSFWAYRVKVVEDRYIRQWIYYTYCKPTRYKYSTAARTKFCNIYIS